MSSDPVRIAAAPVRTAPGGWRRRVKQRSTLHAHGEPMLWLTGGALGLALFMIAGLLVLVVWQGIFTFWPGALVEVTARSGERCLGEVVRRERYTPEPGAVDALAPDEAAAARRELEAHRGQLGRRLIRIGNFDITGEHFRWLEDFRVAAETRPAWAVLVERTSWGRCYGIPRAFRVDGEVVAETPEAVWEKYRELHGAARARRARRKALESGDIGRINHALEQARLGLRKVELESGRHSAAWAAAEPRFLQEQEAAAQAFARVQEEIHTIERENARYQIVCDTYHRGQIVPATVMLGDIVRAFAPNRLSFVAKLGVYVSRWREFLCDEPREANSEGGVWPAIFGTAVMTLIMCLVVVPFGVLAALYLREYARAGFIVSAVRIAVNNLAGVPSIVFGVFGLGFFCYIIGASIDQLLFAARLPNPTYGNGGVLWASLTLALLTLPVVIVATEEALAAVPNSMREGSYACGAAKWQTVRRIVLPRAMPGIMTGMILAMARGAGEVAPLMLVGAAKVAPDLPLDGIFPYLHPERKFMHLGFHIYDLGFQSQNSEAARPMVFTTTLLLIAIVAALNLFAIWLRARLRRKFVTGQF
ncbi:MAG: phosphate ABC transporter permease PstA [Planctomycetes bacterium]|nr:phosphate ABC transporter permease PstA [Planctomycetota bacterium]